MTFYISTNKGGCLRRKKYHKLPSWSRQPTTSFSLLSLVFFCIVVVFVVVVFVVVFFSRGGGSGMDSGGGRGGSGSSGDGILEGCHP